MLRLILIGGFLIAFSSANAQDSVEEQFLQSKVNKVDAKLALEKSRSTELRAELAKKKGQLSKIRSENVNIEAELKRVAAQVNSSSKALSEASKQLESLNQEVALDQELIVKIEQRTQELELQKQAQKAQMQDSLAREKQLDDEPKVAVNTAEAEDVVKAEPQAQHESEAQVDIDAEQKAEKKDSAVAKSAKAGGDFVKKEASNVVKNAARKTVRDGVKGLLGL